MKKILLIVLVSFFFCSFSYGQDTTTSNMGNRVVAALKAISSMYNVLYGRISADSVQVDRDSITLFSSGIRAKISMEQAQEILLKRIDFLRSEVASSYEDKVKKDSGESIESFYGPKRPTKNN